MKIKYLLPLFKKTAAEWSADKAPRLGAALAYYTIFSIAPLIVISITVAGLVLDKAAAKTQILSQIQSLLGDKGAEVIGAMIEAANKPAESIVATTLGLLTLLFGAAGVFVQLKDALNTIWNVKPKTGGGIMGFFKTYFLSFSMVLGIGFLLLVTLLLSAGMAGLGEYIDGRFPALGVITKIGGVLVSFGMITVLFAMMFKFLPDVEVSWHDVWLGAIMTSVLFVVGKLGLGLYLGKASIGSAYGAAGSLVLILVWVYYSAQILFFGAEFTQVYSNFCGKRSCLNPNAFGTEGREFKSRKEELVSQSNHRRHQLEVVYESMFGTKHSRTRALLPEKSAYRLY